MQLELSLLSKYRTQLMGLAMLWVMLCHSQLATGITIIDIILRCGYGGVDIFLLLSGVGLFFSLNKNSEPKQFYKKRILRILPYYLPIVFVFSLFLVFRLNMNPEIILYNITTLSFWLNYTGVYFLHGFDWYIPSLLFLYAITPLYYYVFTKKPILSTVIISIIGLIISYIIGGTAYCYLLPLTTRIPIYFIGIFCGYAITKNIQINITWTVLLFTTLLLGLALLFISYLWFSSYALEYGITNYPFILITLPLVLIISHFLSLLPNYKYPFLSFVGTYSLVIYLLHERILCILNNTVDKYTTSILIKISAIILSFIIGYYYQNSIDRLINRKKI